MKKLICVSLSLICVFAFVVILNNAKPIASAESYEVVVSDFEQLKSAFSSASASKTVNVTLACDIEIKSDLSLKGNLNIKANNKEKLVFDFNNDKTGISLSKNSSIGLDNVTIVRRAINETEEKFLFYTYDKQVTLNFANCVFDVATQEVVSLSFDRIVYCSTENALTCYLNNCTFNTSAYFYRGTYVVFNCDTIPQSAGKAVVKDFTGLKIDYQNNQITFPSDINVSEDADFTQNIKSGAKIKSNFTYYALKGDFQFAFTTRNLKYETPTEASVQIDFANEIINYDSAYAVYSDESLSKKVESGSAVNPGQKLYIVQLASGIFQTSDTFCYELPLRPAKRELTADFTCYFGFVIQHVNNMEYRLNGGEWQKSPVFIGLNSSTEYVVDMRVSATANSFVSEIYTIRVTTSENN